MSEVAGVVLAGGRSTRMGRPKANLEWHGSTLLHRVTGIVGRAVAGPVVVVRAPDQELPELPPGVRVVEDAAEGRGPLQGLAAGLAAVAAEAELAYVSSTDVPLLHPTFVSAVVRAARSEDVDVALPVVHGFRHPLAAAYRTSLLPAVEELIAEDRMRPAFLFERSRVRELSEDDLLRDRELAEADPELLSVLNVNEPDDYERARSRAAPSVTVRRFGTLATNLGREPIAIRAATLEAAATAAGLALDRHVVAALNGDQITRHPELPLAGGDEIAFLAADAGGLRPVRVPDTARLVTIELDGTLGAAEGALLVRGDAHPFTLAGDWAGGGALVGSEPLVVAGQDDDPFALIDRQPDVADAGGGETVGGGWFGYLGYNLGARLERVPPPPPRHVPLPDFALAFYDHLLRLDGTGRWWFEALWTDERADALNARLELLRGRLAEGVRERPVWVGNFQPAPPGGAGHMSAIDECRERIAAGEIFQANLCLRLEAEWQGDPLDLFARTAGTLEPRHAGVIAGEWGAVCSLSPELFLRRRGREVITEPIKGTAPRVLGEGREGSQADDTRAALAASVKDRAENVMIVDLMRNDLGRVCEYGSVEVAALNEPRPAPGVWHLVSTVRGTLRPDARDSDLLRASFPPGSVTGAPKIQAMRVIAELEAGGREAYTGAIGYASPVAGLELNVAIRTLELRGERIWMGAGGGIVADSVAEKELEECFVKARPVLAAAGARLIEEPRVTRIVPVPALIGQADRSDAALGVFETILVRGSVPIDLRAHLARLARSTSTLYGAHLPADIDARVMAAAAGAPSQRLRLVAVPEASADGTEAKHGREACELRVEIGTEPLAAETAPEPVVLAPVVLPGGLGAHKWRDRRLLDELTERLDAVPLIVDLDGDVLETAYANVFVVEGTHLVTPPLDGRQLPGTVRARVLALHPAREERLTLDRVAAADELLLASSIRGIHPARLVDGEEPRFHLGARLRAALREDSLGVAAR